MWLKYIVFLSLTISLVSCDKSRKTTSWKDFFFGGFKRDSRFLPLFTVVQIGPGNCVASSGEVGNCLPTSECALRGGIISGPCAGGFGSCCIFMQTCGGIIRENTTYFVNPNHPDVYDSPGSCQITVQKLHPDICQLRLDFDMLTIAPPENLNHICNQDQLLVSGGSPVPTICGSNNGDHMYVDAGLGQSNPIMLSIITSGVSFPRIWRIRITQIHCGSISRAPQGCLQYHTGINGKIKSFNYNVVSGRQLSNQDYSICIRTERNFCSVQYSACPDLENNRSRAFTISGNSNTVVGTMVGVGGGSLPNACGNDWLLFGCVKTVDRVQPQPNYCEDRICGGTFNAEVSTNQRPVISNIRPFRIYFHADNVESPSDVDNRGFCLEYVQQPCTNGLFN